MQHRVLDILAQQIMLGGLTSSAHMELRRLGPRDATPNFASISPYLARRLRNDF